MREISTGLLATLFLAACIVVRKEPEPAPLPRKAVSAASPSVSSYSYSTGYTPATYDPEPYVYTPSWPDVRYVVWTEYYDCTPEEVYYLENAGVYHDGDLFYILCVSRWARVPIRQVVYEYNRCGRSLFVLGLSYGLSGYELYCPEVPPSVYCPSPYGRAYRDYWSGRLCYLTNAECRALVYLKIGIEYYGYSARKYFDTYSRTCQQGIGYPFHTMAVRDRRRAGIGNRTVLSRPITPRPRPWEARSRSAWETYRSKRRAAASITAARERERDQQARRMTESDARRKHRAEAVRRTLELKTFREQADRGYPAPKTVRAAAPERPAKTKNPTFAFPAARNPRAVTPPPSASAAPPKTHRVPTTRPAPSRPHGVVHERIILPSNPPARAVGRTSAPAPRSPIYRAERSVPAPAPKPPTRRVERRTPPYSPPPNVRRPEPPRIIERRPPPPRRQIERTPPPPPPRRIERRPPPPPRQIERTPPPPPRRVERRPPPPPRRSGGGVQRRTPPPSQRSGSGSRGRSRR